MKLSKILSCLVPIATLGVATPFIASCGNNNLDLKFGDSVNCAYSKEKDYTKIAKLYKKNVVFASAQLLVEQYDQKTITADTANADKTLQTVYGDFIASLSYSGSEYTKFFLECKLAADSSKFDIFNFTKPDGTLIPGENVELSKFDYYCSGDRLSIRYTPSQGSAIEAISYKYINAEAQK